MRIAAISDTHGRHHALDMEEHKATILIHSGDWTKGKDEGLAETQNFLSWLSEQSYDHKIIIAGNHEKTIAANPQMFRELLLQYPDITYLENSEVIIEGIKFYGSPYSNRFGAWAFMDDDIALARIWTEIPDDTNVLITHGPAYGVNDVVKYAYGRDPHVGSQSLTHRKKELESTLKYHISGHIHEAYGVQENANCINICASILDENYNFVNKPIVFDIDDK